MEEQRRILVTGATGFIGRQTIPFLLERGFEVHAVASRPRQPGAEGVRSHMADLLDPRQVDALTASVRATHLLHLAWSLEPGHVFNSLENLRWVEASVRLLLGFAANGGRRATIAGSCSEYAPSDQPCRESSTPLAPQNLYGVCKQALGSLALAAGQKLELSTAWARIFFVYGPGEHPARLVPSIAGNLLRDRVAPCSHGQQVRDYLYSVDVGSALVSLLASEVTGPVNVGSGEPIAVADLATRVGEALQRSSLLRFGEVIPSWDEPPVLVADVGRLRRDVGWGPAYSLDAGLGETIEWWRTQLDAPGAGAATR